jgi:hypothetical protein
MIYLIFPLINTTVNGYFCLKDEKNLINKSGKYELISKISKN